MESEFFGYRKGAFTGADDDRDGFFQAANGGTLFLDEVADLPLAMQVKLLRAIQEKTVRKVGATRRSRSTCASSAPPTRTSTAMVEPGDFRQDLFYRLNVIEFAMPPLREMPRGHPAARAHASLDAGSRRGGRRAELDAGGACARCRRYPFPGNVRELENILERAACRSAARSAAHHAPTTCT